MMTLATIVSCGTRPLAGLLAKEVPIIAAKTEIVPDALDDARSNPVPPTLTDHLQLWWLRRFFRRNAGALHLFWFCKCKKG